MSDILAKFHAKLREAGIEPPGASVVPNQEVAPATEPPVVDTPAGPKDTTATPTPNPGPSPMGDALATPEQTRFPSNPHRFNFMVGEAVCFYDETGSKQEGVIASPPQGDKCAVTGVGGRQHTVLKSELFYAPGAMADPQMADPAAEEGTSAQPAPPQ